MSPFLKTDRADIESLLHSVLGIAAEQLSKIENLPTAIPAQGVSLGDFPEKSMGAAAALEVFMDKYAALMVASTGSRYWGFVTGGTTPAALAGDWLCSLYDQNPQAFAAAGDVSVVMEHDAVNLLRRLLDLPDHFFGGFVSGATMSNFTGLAVARQWAGQERGIDVAAEGLSGMSDLKVLSAVPHSCVHKDLAMLGLGRNQLIPLSILPGREAVDVSDLESHLKQLNGVPCIVSSSGGTVNTVDFDDFQAIAALKKRYRFWWHIDAAFGAFAACSPAYQSLLTGWHEADSIAVDLHKWLNVPYDSAVAFIREEHQHLQLQTFQNANAAYLGDPKADMNMLNFFPENSRRLRALPAWMTLMAYGQEGYQQLVETCVDAAQYFGEKIEESQHFQLLAPVRLNVVCFHLRWKSDEETQRFLQKLNAGAQVFMTPTRYDGQGAIRAAFVNWQTTRADVDMALREMEKYC